MITRDPQRRWCEAFPWIVASYGASEADTLEVPGWLTESIDDRGAARHKELVAELAYLASTRFSHLKFGEIFPEVCRDVRFKDLPLPKRLYNLLGRQGYLTFRQLMNSAIVSLLQARGVGAGLLNALLQILAETSLSCGAREHAHRIISASEPAPERGSESQLAEAMRTFEAWCAALGLMYTNDRLHWIVKTQAPPEIRQAYHRLRSAGLTPFLAPESSEQIVSEAPHVNSARIADVLDRQLMLVRPRLRLILQHRLLAIQLATLDELASLLGVTRERVRQLESQARDSTPGLSVRRPNFSDETHLIALVCATVRRAVDAALPLASLIERFPALGAEVPAVGLPAWRVLERLGKGFEIHDGWSTVPAIQDLQECTRDRIQELMDDFGVVRIDRVGRLNDTEVEARDIEHLREWLLYCGYSIYGDFLFTCTRPMSHWAAAILSVARKPLSSQELQRWMHGKPSRQALRDALNGDDRMHRVDLDRWALRSWNLPEYPGIRALMKEELDRAGGRVRLSSLQSAITARASVSPKSVAIYAASPPFLTVRGEVTYADKAGGPECSDSVSSRARTQRPAS